KLEKVGSQPVCTLEQLPVVPTDGLMNGNERREVTPVLRCFRERGANSLLNERWFPPANNMTQLWFRRLTHSLASLTGAGSSRNCLRLQRLARRRTIVYRRAVHRHF